MTRSFKAAIGINLYDFLGIRIPNILERIGTQKEAFVSFFFVGTPLTITFYSYVLLYLGS